MKNIPNPKFKLGEIAILIGAGFVEQRRIGYAYCEDGGWFYGTRDKVDELTYHQEGHFEKIT